MSYEVVRLAPVRVASYRYSGDDPHPQDRAMERVLCWAEKHSLLPPVVRFYIAFPIEGPDDYGMAALLPVQETAPDDGLVTFEETSGGLYALRKGFQPWGEYIFAAEEEMGQSFMPWVEANGFEVAKGRLLLQEHIVGARYVNRPFRDDPGFRIDWYLPIREKSGAGR